MKINPLEWNEINETTFSAQGLLLLRSSQPFALAIETMGVEVAVGAETHHKIPLAEPSKVTVVGGKAKVYRKAPPPRLVVSNEETFTNIDRLPQESGTMQEVTKAVRLMKLEERAMIRRIREERQIAEMVIAQRKAREKAEQEEAEKVLEGGPQLEPAPKPAGKAEADPDAKPQAKEAAQ